MGCILSNSRNFLGDRNFYMAKKFLNISDIGIFSYMVSKICMYGTIFIWKWSHANFAYNVRKNADIRDVEKFLTMYKFLSLKNFREFESIHMKLPNVIYNLIIACLDKKTPQLPSRLMKNEHLRNLLTCASLICEE